MAIVAGANALQGGIRAFIRGDGLEPLQYTGKGVIFLVEIGLPLQAILKVLRRKQNSGTESDTHSNNKDGLGSWNFSFPIHSKATSGVAGRLNAKVHYVDLCCCRNEARRTCWTLGYLGEG